jgi:hypothetical protein
MGPFALPQPARETHTVVLDDRSLLGIMAAILLQDEDVSRDAVERAERLLDCVKAGIAARKS